MRALLRKATCPKAPAESETRRQSEGLETIGRCTRGAPRVSCQAGRRSTKRRATRRYGLLHRLEDGDSTSLHEEPCRADRQTPGVSRQTGCADRGRIWGCDKLQARGETKVGQASRLPGERASASGASAVPTRGRRDACPTFQQPTGAEGSPSPRPSWRALARCVILSARSTHAPAAAPGSRTWLRIGVRSPSSDRPPTPNPGRSRRIEMPPRPHHRSSTGAA